MRPDVWAGACSYIRGKPDTGDVDMLILPPPSCIELDSNLTLHEVLQLLRKRGLLLDEMLLRKAPREKGPGSSATFLGLCRHATSPCVRRIDLKWYPRRLARCAACTVPVMLCDWHVCPGPLCFLW